MFVSPDRSVRAGAGGGVPHRPGEKLSRGHIGGTQLFGIPPRQTGPSCPCRGERAGLVCLVSKVHVANRRPPPPPRSGGAGVGATETDSCGWGQREGPGVGRAREPARVPLSFETKESLSVRHLSLPGGPRKWSSGGQRPEESLCARGPSGMRSVSRASCGGSSQPPG